MAVGEQLPSGGPDGTAATYNYAHNKPVYDLPNTPSQQLHAGHGYSDCCGCSSVQ
jgi:hypothetical protein